MNTNNGNNKRKYNLIIPVVMNIILTLNINQEICSGKKAAPHSGPLAGRRESERSIRSIEPDDTRLIEGNPSGKPEGLQVLSSAG